MSTPLLEGSKRGSHTSGPRSLQSPVLLMAVSVVFRLGPGLLSPMVSPLKGLGPPPLPPSSQSHSPGGQPFPTLPSKPPYPPFQNPPPPPLPSPQGKLWPGALSYIHTSAPARVPRRKGTPTKGRQVGNRMTASTEGHTGRRQSQVTQHA